MFHHSIWTLKALKGNKQKKRNEIKYFWVMYCIWSHSFVLWMFCLLSQNTEPESLYFINIILMGLLWIEYWSLSDYHGYFLKQWSLSWGQQVKIYKDSLKKIKFSLGKKIIKKDFTEKYRTEHDRNNVKQTIFHLQKTARREFRNGRRGNSRQMSGSTLSYGG